MWKTINSQNVVEFMNILSLWVEKGWTSISSIPYIVGKLMCWIRRAFRRTKKRGQRTMGLWGKKSGLDWARNFRRRGFHLAWGERRKGWLGCEKQKIWRPSYKSCTHLSVFKWQTNCRPAHQQEEIRGVSKDNIFWIWGEGAFSDFHFPRDWIAEILCHFTVWMISCLNQGHCLMFW